MRKEISLLLGSVLILLQIGTIGAVYDDLPKLIVRDGNLILESGVDKNITIHLKGRSWFNINDMNLLKMIDGFRGRGHQGLPIWSEDDINGGISVQLGSLNARIRTLSERIIQLENGTRINGQNYRLRNAFRRITLLETKIERLMTKITEDNCRSNPCQNGGTCTDLYDTFMCKCPPNWEGTTCGQDVNECAQFAGTDLGCQNRGQCVNTQGSYNCLCSAGWVGIHCTQRNADCKTSSALELCGHGTCINAAGTPGYRCICEQGWKTNGVTPACTVDINECTEMKPPCTSTCINLPGSFACGPCPVGFTGNGYVCHDINECALNNGGCSSNPLVACINSYGSYHCGECPLGWTGDGKTCTRVEGGACSRNICHPSATCREISNVIVCSCPVGMNGNGVGPSGCTAGFVDPCQNRCLNGGTCVANGTTSTCLCPAGTLQPNCDRPYDPCMGNPCQNGGTCVIQANRNRYRCLCPIRYRGRQCQAVQTRCGGVLTAPSGTLKYPLTTTYDHNQRCAWLIRTNSTQVLNITFNKFNLESSLGCFFDWLQIHDGGSSASQMIGRFCGSELPKGGKIISTHNMLYFWFRSDNSTAHDGFELTWDSIDPVCGGEIAISTHGTIASPGSPSNYPPNRDCEWHLIGPYSKRIQIMFFTMQLESHKDCDYDYLAIYDGSSAQGPLLEKYCNTSHPPPITTPSHEVTLHFHSDSDNTDAGFQLHYTVVEGFPGCGGIFTGTKGEFGTPVASSQYPHNLECDYLIKLPAQNKIKIHFLEFELENAWLCDFDYVEIYDGSTDQDPKVGRWCGTNKPKDYKSETNTLLIKFKSDFSHAEKGFRLQYDTICGGTFKESEGEFTSPMYPENYLNSRLCEYIIEAPAGKAIQLEFQDFHLERGLSILSESGELSTQCEFDFVEIFDGVSTTSSFKYCGNGIPPMTLSKSNLLTLKLQTDESHPNRGFRANYTFIDIGCGGIFKEPHALIKPPIFRDGDVEGYAHNAHCEWIILAPLGFQIQLSWLSFHLEETTDCYYDYVQIYDNGTQNGGKVGRYCGTNTPPTFVSSSNIITITFDSDQSDTGEGFTATYYFLDSNKICGGNYFSSSGLLTSPNYPADYPENKKCIWTITVPGGNQIELNIKKFSLESQISCVFDYLEIRNGINDASPLIGTYCGEEIPNRIPSFSNQLYIKFVSDYSGAGTGFEIEWDGTTTGCGGQTTTHRGTITSPNYPGPYDHNAQCDWRIIVSKGSRINIIIPDLQLEASSECYYDYIEIFEGFGHVKHSVGKYCSSPNDLIHVKTARNEALVRFVSDSSFATKGFQLSYSTDCNNELSEPSGVIESPHFPNLYPENLLCQWTIKGRKGSSIIVHFTHLEFEFDIFPEAENPCQYDFVEISEKKENRYELMKKFCKKPTTIFNSTSEMVMIKFKSDSSGSGIGFRLEYQIQGCGEILNRPSGELKSPNYPNRYPHDTACEWIIETEFGHVIELNVTDLDIEGTSDCDYDSLILANGRDAVHQIAKYCGKNSSHTSVRSNGNSMFVQFLTDFSNHGRGFNATYRSIPSKCGGTFKNNKGVIHSPHYPKNYEPYSDCQWLIQAEDYTTISFKFTEFDLESSINCTADSVKIYDGKDVNSDSLLSTHCGNNLPNITRNTTTSNYMLVVLLTDGDTEYKGFQLEYNTNCGRTIYANDTGFLSAFFSHIVEDCIWTIVAEPGQHVTFTTTQFEMSLRATISENTDEDCQQGGVKFYDGDSIRSPLKSKFCSTFPKIQTSFGNTLTILVESRAISDFQGFYSIYENACGGNLTSLTGKFSSPQYPESYPVNVECIWRIVATPGNILELNIEELDIEKSDSCNEDYLEVRQDGPTGKILGVFCGNEPAPKMTGTAELWIKFKSNDDDVGKGFIARYNYAQNIEITGTNGTITSPRYPNLITTGEAYNWRIMVPRGNVIRATFPHGRDNSQYYYELKFTVYDGYDDTAVPLELDSDATTFISSTNNLYIATIVPFFQIDWTTVAKSDLNDSAATNSTCKEMITIGETAHLIKSPGYPYGYKENLNCEWIFTTAEGTTHPVLHLANVDIEDNGGCYSDYLRVSNSKDMVVWNELLKTCKSELNTMRDWSGNPFLKIEFVSDFMGNKTGFSGVVVPVCGGKLTKPSGTITINRNTLLNNLGNMECNWTVEVRRGRQIKFEFESLIIPKQADITCVGYVMIKNGGDDESPILGTGKYCEDNKPNIPVTTTNHAFVKFKYQTPIATWSLKYSEVQNECGSDIRLTANFNTTTISSPNYPNIPNLHSQCIWQIMAPQGEHIQVKFDSFDLTTTTNCDKEYVEVRNGGSELSPLIGIYCSQPNSIDSIDNFLRIMYFTDTTDPKPGFKATVSIGKCGGMYHDREGVITSKNYPLPGGYPSNSICEYRIVRPVGSVINITFTDANLPAGDCITEDHLAISSVNGVNDNRTEESDSPNICGSFTAPYIVAGSNEVVIRFKTFKHTVDYRGFRLSYNSTQNECGGSIIAEEGLITTPGYPNGWLKRVVCVWRITVPKGRRVRMEILDYDLRMSSVQNYTTFRRFPVMMSGLRTGFFNDHRYLSNIAFFYRETPSVIYSTDNTMLVTTWLSTNTGYRGFKMRFTSNEPTICEGSLASTNGSIQLPATNGSFFCLYDAQIQQPNQTIAIKFRNIVLLSKYPIFPGSCEFRALISVLNGRKVMMTLCSNVTETTLRSPYPDTKLRLIQVPERHYIASFNMTYRRHDCGGIILLNDPYTISNPVITSSSYGELDCAWHITTADQEQSFPFQITGTIKMKLDCDKEYLTIMRTPKGPHLGRYCGQMAIANLTTLHEAFVEYHSDNYQNDSNFNVSIEEINECGDHILTAPRTIKLGKEYKNNIECIWTIKSNSGYHIEAEFIDRFFVEESPNCSKDVLEIYDFDQNEWKLIGRVCGRTKPSNMKSSGNQLRLKFKSDGSILGDGFTIRFSKKCGGIYPVTSKLLTLSSPNYPEYYDGNLSCNYTFVSPKSNSQILIRFKDFELESIGNCRYDNVTIYTYQYDIYTKLDTYCKDNSLSELRHKKQIGIVFQTDSNSHRKGFLLEYQLDECGGIVNETQMISSPKIAQDSKYPSNLQCFWNITAPQGKQIAIKFEFFETEISARCYYDYVHVYSGKKIISDSPKHVLCGNLTGKIPIIAINDNNAIVYFHSDSDNAERGFSAWILFKDQCDETIVLNDNNPSYSFDKFYGTHYADDLNCNFVFEAPDGYHIRANFEQFHIAPCVSNITDSCSCDYLVLYDGAGPFAEIIGQYCGHTLPPTVTSTRTRLFARFVSDSLVTSSGFKATFSMQATLCGRTNYEMEDDTKSITVQTPGTTYPPNLRCLWKITSSKNTLHIHFEKFDLEGVDENKNCSKDAVQIYSEDVAWTYDNGLDKEVIVNGQESGIINAYSDLISKEGQGRHEYCGNHTPVDYYSNSNTVYVKFKSNADIQKAGIRFTATSAAGCFKNYSGTQGRILLNSNLDCEFYIIAPDNYTLSLYFHAIFALDENCDVQAFSIYDATNNTLLKKYCGQLEPSSSIFSSSSKLRIKVKNTGMYSRYDATFLASNSGPGCGGQLSNYGGIFTNPFYPLNLRNDSDCRWDIQVPNNMNVALVFEVFDLGAKSTCRSDYLQIIEFEENTENVARQYCGEDKPSTYRGRTNRVAVRFRKSVNFDGTGWVIKFGAIHSDTKLA